MTMKSLLVALGLALMCLASAEDTTPPSIVLKQLAYPPVVAAPVVSQPLVRAFAPRAVTPLAIGAITVLRPASALSVPLFGTFELEIALSTDVTGVQRFNPDPTSSGLDLSATFTGPGMTPTVIARNGFFHGTSGKWLVRFAPTEVGIWNYVVTAKDPSNTTGVTSSSGSLTCVTSANPGFIHINGSRLRFSDGSLFYGIGHNNGWQNDVEQPSQTLMATHGENLLSFWISQPWATTNERKPIENISGGIGNYSQTTCDYLDAVLGRAEQNGIYLLPSIWSHDALRLPNQPWGGGDWTNNAYSDPAICTFPIDFFITTSGMNDTPAWIRQKRFFRYLTARYGHSTALAGWVGVVEIEGTGAYAASVTNGPATATAWCQAVRDWFIANDTYRAISGTHPISFSKSDEGGASANTFGATGGFPLHVADSYASKNNSSAIANTIATATRTMGGFGVVSGAPAFTTEFGAPIGGGASDPLHYHNGIWAGVAAGASMMPLKWCDDGSWPMFTDSFYGLNYRNHTKYLSAFVNTPAVKTVMGSASATAITTIAFPSFTGRVGWGLQLSDAGFAWLHRTAGGAMANTAVTLSGCPIGRYQIDWIDPWTNGSTPTASQTVDVVTGSTLALVVPAGITQGDVAVRYQRIFTATAQAVTVDSLTSSTSIITLSGTGGGTLTGATITSLPVRGTLFQVTNLGAKGAAISSVPTALTDSQLRVWYQPPDPLVTPPPGTDQFTFTVNDSSTTSASANVTITVRNHAPSFLAGGNVSVNEDDPAFISSPAWATNISSDGTATSATDGTQTLTFQLTGNTNAALFSAQPAISSAGVLTFTPAANQHGTANVTVALKDNGGTAGGGSDTSATTTLSITVTSANDAPVANPVNLTAYPGQIKVITLSATDADGDALTYALVPGITPAGAGTLSAVSGTSVTLTLASNVPPGTVTFSYNATDSFSPAATSANAAVTVTVIANASPNAIAQSVTVTQNTATGITLTGSDTPPFPNATLTFAVVSGPSNGTLSGTAPYLTYQPTAGYTGPDAFTFTVNDGAVSSAAATVSIVVAAAGSAPVPIGTTTSGGGCGLGGTAAVALLGLLAVLGHVGRLVRRRPDPTVSPASSAKDPIV